MLPFTLMIYTLTKQIILGIFIGRGISYELKNKGY